LDAQKFLFKRNLTGGMIPILDCTIGVGHGNPVLSLIHRFEDDTMISNGPTVIGADKANVSQCCLLLPRFGE
jgi:hypothetical protein